MSSCLHTLFAAWGDPTEDGRAEKSSASVDPGIYYADPNTPEPLFGMDAYLGYIAGFARMMPGGTADVVAVSEHNGHARATVAFRKDGSTMMQGQYFADIHDGKVTRLIGFPGTGEPA